jgi:hypothetical protein
VIAALAHNSTVFLGSLAVIAAAVTALAITRRT